MTPQDAQSASTADDSAPPGERVPPGGSMPPGERVPPGEPLLPEQSREDTEEGWGEYAGRDDDWLRRDRPPHWADY